MSTKMLIDASHPEETRVAIVDHTKRLEEFDFESTTKKTIKGNIYLAKVMRVEPSLQAAFVDYGGNRHGFLAFSEIHPDYFRIPISDREALEAKLKDVTREDETPPDDIEQEVNLDEGDTSSISSEGAEVYEYDMDVSTIAGESIDPLDETEDEVKAKRPPLHRLYKIQEVIHKNQILLVQAIKEERGQKGAALTTYLSLAGRYCVLMPNSPQAGGISRKISNPNDRKRLREILVSLDISADMGLIIRTAGLERTRIELRRDAEYLNRLWHDIRTDTLKSIAPALIYQEDNIIKRSIRDQYSKEIEEILVEGEESYKLAKNFIKKLMPSHAKRVQLYKDDKIPLFIKYKVEQQIEAMYHSTVQLPSGGSIVINPTEALVAIDINSGRSTRERHIDATALSTNLEAATEIARQVRLRDLAGLIVIDFIDMDDRKYIAQVERKVREAFKNDRARVQMSKISPFGLLELSRQRLRPSILETSSDPCPHCHATGYVRSTESMALQILRALEEEGIAQRSAIIKAVVPPTVAFYILNDKRMHLSSIEARHKIQIVVQPDSSLIPPEFRLIQVERLHAPDDMEGSDTQAIPAEREHPNAKGKAKQASRNHHAQNSRSSRPRSERSTDNVKRHPKEQHARKHSGTLDKSRPAGKDTSQAPSSKSGTPSQAETETTKTDNASEISGDRLQAQNRTQRRKNNRNNRYRKRQSPTNTGESENTQSNKPGQLVDIKPQSSSPQSGEYAIKGEQKTKTPQEKNFKDQRHQEPRTADAPKDKERSSALVKEIKPSSDNKIKQPINDERTSAGHEPGKEADKKKQVRTRKNWLKRLLE